MHLRTMSLHFTSETIGQTKMHSAIYYRGVTVRGTSAGSASQLYRASQCCACKLCFRTWHQRSVYRAPYSDCSFVRGVFHGRGEAVASADRRLIEHCILAAPMYRNSARPHAGLYAAEGSVTLDPLRFGR